MRLRRRGVVTLTALCAVALAACGGDDDTGPVAGTEPPSEIDHPTGADELVVRVATGGGPAGPSTRPAEVPELSVYGDGRAIVIGPTTLEFPGAALPNLQQGRLGDDALEELVRSAFTAGLLDDDPPDYGEPAITDQATTVVTVHAGDVERTVSVYGLRSEEEGSGLTPEQRAARERLRDFLDVVDADVATEFYEAEAVAVLVRPYRADEAPDPSLAAEPRQWPLGDLADAGEPYAGLEDTRCLAVDGADAQTVLDAAADSREGDPWRAGDADYALVFRPLLPDETGCADLEAARGAGT